MRSVRVLDPVARNIFSWFQMEIYVLRERLRTNICERKSEKKNHIYLVDNLNHYRRNIHNQKCHFLMKTYGATMPLCMRTYYNIRYCYTVHVFSFMAFLLWSFAFAPHSHDVQITEWYPDSEKVRERMRNLWRKSVYVIVIQCSARAKHKRCLSTLTSYSKQTFFSLSSCPHNSATKCADVK